MIEVDDLPGKVAPVGKWLRREYVAARPVFLFFLAGFLILVLIVTLVFGLYFALSEINERMGAGELWNLFFGSPGSANRSSQPVVPVGNVRN